MQVFMLFLTLAAACMVRSVEGDGLAFVFANQETNPSYTANPSYVYNAGLPVQITRAFTGIYRVFFNRLVDVGTHVQVTMFSNLSETGWCNLQNVYPPGFSLKVICFDENGLRADRKFLALVIEACGTSSEYLAFARLNNPFSPSYYAVLNWRFGDGTFLTNSLPPGQARVDLGPVADTGAAVLATTFHSRKYCTIADWLTGTVYVDCRDASVNLANSRSNVIAIKAGFPHTSFARNDGITVGALNPAYSYSSDGSTQTISGGGGLYSVEVGPEADVGGHVQVVAYDSEANCYVSGFGSGTVSVFCAAGGVIVGSKFVVLAIA